MGIYNFHVDSPAAEALTLVFPGDGYAHYHPQQDEKYGMDDRIGADEQTGQPNGDRVDAESSGALADRGFGNQRYYVGTHRKKGDRDWLSFLY